MIGSYMCECPASSLKHVCRVNEPRQRLSSFSSWPPHCVGDQQGLPPPGVGAWREQTSCGGQLSSVPGPQVWSLCSSHLSLESLYVRGGEITGKGVTSWQCELISNVRPRWGAGCRRWGREVGRV